MSDRPGRTIVVTAEHRLFRKWCSENKRSMQDPNILVITESSNPARRFHGWRWEADKDELVWLETPQARISQRLLHELRQVLIPMGCQDL